MAISEKLLRYKINLIFGTICHTLVDYICITTLYQCIEESTRFKEVLLYNLLAFGTQSIIGYYIDKTKNKWIGIGGALLVSGTGLISADATLRVILLGLGNAMFHVGTSLFMINESDGKLSDLGIFVSSGAIGVGLANISYIKSINVILITLSILWSTYIKKIKFNRNEDIDFGIANTEHLSIQAIIYITFTCIVIRSIGSKPLHSVQGNIGVMIGFVSACIGKALGGILSDRYGAKNIGILAMILSMISLSFITGIVGIVIGIICFNVAMPITLGVIIDKLGDYKCFGFGLTTLGLLVGSMVVVIQDKNNISKNILEMVILSGIALVLIMITTKNKRRK